MTALLHVEALVREYTLPRPRLWSASPKLRVLHGIDLALEKGGSLGIVGESGSGKSTLARTVLALERPQSGTVRLNGIDLFTLTPAELRAARRHFQAVFQDPYGSLDPRLRVASIVAEPVAALEPAVSRAARHERVVAMLNDVGLPGHAAERYPHEFSGGQRQRIAIARALITRPALVVADEPVSALDVSVQAQVLALMRDLQQRLGLAWLFISHDLAVVRGITAEVAVLYRGRVVEQGPTAEVFVRPLHPYTRALLDAVPGHFRARQPAPAQPELPAGGCPYAGRCRFRQPRCLAELPVLQTAGAHRAACHFPL